MTGLLLGLVISSWFSYFVNILLVSKYIGYKSYRQLLDIFPVMIASILPAAIVYLMGILLKLSMYPDGIIKVVAYIVIYCGWSLIFKPEAYIYFKGIVYSKLSKKSK